jgi:hypothetical protein
MNLFIFNRLILASKPRMVMILMQISGGEIIACFTLDIHIKKLFLKVKEN